MLVELRGRAVDENVEEVLLPSYPDHAAARRAVAFYRSGEWRLYGWRLQSKIVGCVGFECVREGAILRSLAVSPSYRGQGIGRAMVEGALRALEVPWVEAETDAEAVGFYRRLGFTVASLGEKYPAVERFRCVRASFRSHE